MSGLDVDVDIHIGCHGICYEYVMNVSSKVGWDAKTSAKYGGYLLSCPRTAEHMLGECEQPTIVYLDRFGEAEMLVRSAKEADYLQSSSAKASIPQTSAPS